MSAPKLPDAYLDPSQLPTERQLAITHCELARLLIPTRRVLSATTGRCSRAHPDGGPRRDVWTVAADGRRL
jgi:hypothetical protein